MSEARTAVGAQLQTGSTPAALNILSSRFFPLKVRKWYLRPSSLRIAALPVGSPPGSIRKTLPRGGSADGGVCF